jgi:hypothetical protein
MSIKVMSYIWEHSKLKGSDLLTLLAIADHADDEGVAYPSILKIAKKTRMTERNVQLVLKKIEKSRELAIIKNAGPHGCHLFQIKPIGVKSFRGEKFSPIEGYEYQDSIKKSVTIGEMEGEKFSGGVKSFRGEKSGKKTHQISPEPSLEPSEDLKPSVFSDEKTYPLRLTPVVLMAWYNEQTPETHPKVHQLSPARRKKADQYLRMFPAADFWRTVFAEITSSSFLLGMKPSHSHECFRADFDWLLSKGKDGTENCLKVAEGKYRDADLSKTPRNQISEKGYRNMLVTKQLLEEEGLL